MVERITCGCERIKGAQPFKEGLSRAKSSKAGPMDLCKGCNGTPYDEWFSAQKESGFEDAPRQLPNSESSWISHFHAHTVKNLSSCSSSACWPSVLRTDVKDPWVSYKVIVSPAHARRCDAITYFELLVPPQDLRAQREVMYRGVVIVVNDTAFGRLCP